jgi:hypothetical protein
MIFFARLLARRNRSNNVVKNYRKVKGFHAEANLDLWSERQTKRLKMGRGQRSKIKVKVN